MREKPYTNYVHQQGTEYGPLGASPMRKPLEHATFEIHFTLPI